MSYLKAPRIHFAGRFQADTSTVNNDVRHFDVASFRPEFQEPMTVKDDKIVTLNGYWNPQGSGAWRLLGCKVTAAVLDSRAGGPSPADPIVGSSVAGSDERVAAKLVDLDPQQQGVSQIWGLGIRLIDARGVPLLRGEFAVAPLSDLWFRQQHTQEFCDQQMAAAYQSVLTEVEWFDTAASPCLTALRDRSAAGLLSIRLNVFGFDRTPGAADYATGVVLGTIGPATAREPRHFALGRQLTAFLPPGEMYPLVPGNQVANIQAEVDEAAGTVGVDFGNALPILDSSGALEDLGPLAFGILKDSEALQGDTVDAAQVVTLGDVPYQAAGWYFQTAGVQDFAWADHPEASRWIGDHPLAVLGQAGAGRLKILNRETAGGVFVRADNFVLRLNPGESGTIDLYATRYGQPLGTAIVTQSTSAMFGGAGTGADLPTIAVPPVNTPAGIIQFAPEVTTRADGRGSLTISASPAGPGNPRLYLDGQVYGIGYQIKDLPPHYNANPFNYVSVLAWDHFEVPAHPTWYADIRPILVQYGNLYPIMSQRLVTLRDYQSVIDHLRIMRLSFSLPPENPNSMPVTRDLSANKRQTILRWMDARDPQTGTPPLGTPPAANSGPEPAGTSAEIAGSTPDLAVKYEFLRQARKSQGGSPPEGGSHDQN